MAKREIILGAGVMEESGRNCVWIVESKVAAILSEISLTETLYLTILLIGFKPDNNDKT
jgi:hypothetical protein